jgi:hypothetical protein
MFDSDIHDAEGLARISAFLVPNERLAPKN